MRTHHYVIVAAAVVASVVVAGTAVAQPYGPGGGMYGWGGGFFPFGMFVGPVIMIALVLLVAWALRSPRASHVAAGAPRRSAGLEVLEERYARGEIGRDEYLQKKADIGA